MHKCHLVCEDIYYAGEQEARYIFCSIFFIDFHILFLIIFCVYLLYFILGRSEQYDFYAAGEFRD